MAPINQLSFAILAGSSVAAAFRPHGHGQGHIHKRRLTPYGYGDSNYNSTTSAPTGSYPRPTGYTNTTSVNTDTVTDAITQIITQTIYAPAGPTDVPVDDEADDDDYNDEGDDNEDEDNDGEDYEADHDNSAGTTGKPASIGAAGATCGGTVTVTLTNTVTVGSSSSSAASQQSSAPAPPPAAPSTYQAPPPAQPTTQAPAPPASTEAPAPPPSSAPAPAPAPATSAPAPPPAATTTAEAPAPPAYSPPAPAPVPATSAPAPAPAASSPAAAPAPASYNGGKIPTKRGCLYEGGGGAACEALAKSGSVSWATNWASNPMGSTGSCQYVPQLAHMGQVDTFAADAKKAIDNGASAVLGFNEPDIAEQGNIDPSSGAAAWNTHIAPYKSQGLTLVSPGVTSRNTNDYYPGIQWLKDFKAAGADWDATAVHFYAQCSRSDLSLATGEALYLKKIVDAAKEAFPGKPVWVTEFGCLPPASTDQIQSFLDVAVPYLDGEGGVAHYAPFKADLLTTGSSAVNAAGSAFLGAVGSTVGNVVNGVGDLVGSVVGGVLGGH